MLGWLKSQVWLAYSSQSQCGILVLKTEHHNKQGLQYITQKGSQLSSRTQAQVLYLWAWTWPNALIGGGANWTILQCLKLSNQVIIMADYDLPFTGYSSFLQLKLAALITRLLAKCRFSITRHLEISVPQSNEPQMRKFLPVFVIRA